MHVVDDVVAVAFTYNVFESDVGSETVLQSDKTKRIKLRITTSIISSITAFDSSDIG